jgi:hypothetical protein
MRTASMTILCTVAAGRLALSSPALAQQKTVKDCRAEWQANKAGNQAKGITQKAYVDQCRSASAAPAAAPAATKSAATPAAPPPAAKPAPAPVPARPGPTVGTAPSGANEFANEALAKAHCPRDLVVWANLNSRIYHFSGHKDYGNTKEGAYMCEKDALGQGVRAAKNEKHP